MRMVLAPILLASVSTCLAQAGDPNYLTVPRVSVQDPAFFRARFEAARTGVVRIAVFGDSQETAPWGWGEHYLAGLNVRFAKVYGPSSESQLFTNHTSIARPMWLATTLESAAITPTTVADNRALPAITVSSLIDGAGSTLGCARTVFLQDASYCASDAIEGGPWFERNGPFVADVLTIARTGSGGLRWRNAPTDADVPDTTAPSIQSGVFPAKAKTVPGTFIWNTTPALSLGGRRHLQLLVEGDQAKSGTDVVGVRFRNIGAPAPKDGTPRGVVVQSFARGGMRIVHLLAEHGESGAMLRALAPSVIVLHYGANDAGNITGVAQWRTQLLETISWLRTQMNDPAYPIIIASELDTLHSTELSPIIDAMPVVAHEIALADSRVLALNLRRITEEEYGWGPSKRYMADTAHFHPYAQTALSEAFVGELTRALAIADPACAAANWADCVRTWGASCEQGGCRLETDMEVIAHGLTWQGAGTTCADGDGDGYSDQCPPAGREDFNNDGFIDAMDLAVLLGAWGEAGHRADLNSDAVVNAPDLSLFLSAWFN